MIGRIYAYYTAVIPSDILSITKVVVLPTMSMTMRVVMRAADAEVSARGRYFEPWHGSHFRGGKEE